MKYYGILLLLLFNISKTFSFWLLNSWFWLKTYSISSYILMKRIIFLSTYSGNNFIQFCNTTDRNFFSIDRKIYGENTSLSLRRTYLKVRSGRKGKLSIAWRTDLSLFRNFLYEVTLWWLLTWIGLFCSIFWMKCWIDESLERRKVIWDFSIYLIF